MTIRPRFTPTALSPSMVRGMSAADRAALGIETATSAAVAPADLPTETAADRKGERALQGQCERMLTLRGYRRLTASEAERPVCDVGPLRGWFGHWPNAERNPLVPDLIVWTPDMTRSLCAEFKVCNRYQPGQLAMIEAGRWVECRTYEEFCLRVAEWETQLDK